MAEHQFEGQRAEADLDGDTITIRCDRRTAQYLAVRLDGSVIPVVQVLRDRLDYLLVGNPGPSRTSAHRGGGGVTGRAAVRKATVEPRVDHAVELVKAEPTEPWLLWAGRNDEARALALDAEQSAPTLFGTVDA